MKANTIDKATAISIELNIIKDLNNGLLSPVNVVEYASDPKTALHSRFQWDDTKAAEEYRVWQARQIISMELIVIRPKKQGGVQRIPILDRKPTDIITRQFVSLRQDRRAEDKMERGYRCIEEVLSNTGMRVTLLEEAKRDMITFKHKYGALIELTNVVSAMDKILDR